MAKVWISDLLILSTLTVCFCLEIKFNTVKIKAIANPGEVKVFSGNEHQVSIQLVSIVEKDASGVDVPANVSVNPHKAENLDAKPFTLPAKIETINATKSEPSQMRFITEQDINLLQDTAKVNLAVMVATSTGNITGYSSNHVYKTAPGDIYLMLRIRNWGFCGATNRVCLASDGSRKVGTMLEVKLRFKIISGKTFTAEPNSVFKVKDNKPIIKVTMETMVGVESSGSVTTHTIAGFPKQDSGVFTIRLRSFPVGGAAMYQFVKVTFSSGVARHAFIGLIIVCQLTALFAI